MTGFIFVMLVLLFIVSVILLFYADGKKNGTDSASLRGGRSVVYKHMYKKYTI